MLDSLFKPRSVALIGASTKELSIGNVIIKNLQRFNFKGPIYPINPKAPEIRGIKAYPTIFDVPGDIDVAHIVIPPEQVPQAVEDCGKKGVKNIIINTAGFKEMGAHGEALQDDFVARGKKYGVRLFGPNCQGIINTDPEFNAYCDFTFTYPEPGHISIVAQSGGVGAFIMQNFFDIGVGMRMYASNGNACDISIPEIMRYWGNDEGTRVIVLYIESVDDPKNFMEIAREVAAKKPILAMSAGRTAEGAKAATSHTGGLAGGKSMELIFKKTGILSFTDAQEMCQAAVAFASQPIPKGNRVGMITNTGGPAIIATDELVDGGLEIPPLSQEAEEKLKLTMFASASINNPIDVVATAGAPQFRSALDVMMDEEQIDSVYINFVTPPFVDCPAVAREFAEVSLQRRKPIVCNYMTDKAQWTETSAILKSGGIPCYEFPGTAAKALAALSRYSKIKSADNGKVQSFDNIHPETVSAIISIAKSEGREMLNAEEAYNILEAYGIPFAQWTTAENLADAMVASENIGFPLVLKADSPEIIHKSDSGGVAVNLTSPVALSSAINKMKANFTGTNLKYFLQKYYAGGKELIIGAKAESGLGHIIVFGMGGIFVEVLKDVSFGLTPISDYESKEMINSIKLAPILHGIRGQKGVATGLLAEIIERISALVTNHPEIQELDLNPVLAFETFAVAVDARIKIK
ncbi:MAG: acetate--CoA ligase family protein [Candidatus Kapabacteria bacterium]|nr:acetate--CoA ligase family protein [Candidatus Kapabacteria bacterium]